MTKEHDGNGACEVPIEEQCASTLEHYERVSTIAHEWNNQIPQAIKAWYAAKAAASIPSATEQKKDWGRAKVGLDGNCGYALLGENLHDGEAEFVEIEGWPTPTYKQEREAWGKALRKLEERLGSGLLRYEVIR